MRVLYASERPPYPFFLGGAARCAHQLLHESSSNLGIECLAVGSSSYAVTAWSYPDPAEFGTLGVRSVSMESRGATVDCGYPIHLFPNFIERLGQCIDTFRPDVVWAQLEGSRKVLELAASKGVQGLLFVHDAEFDSGDLRAIGDLGSHIVCSSGFLAGKVHKVIRRDAHVIYPCPETDFGVEGDRNGSITMINPNPVKGLATFIEIAKRLPTERFLLVESWKLRDEAMTTLREQLAAVPNVRFLHRISDMRQVYSQTRLLLVPSVWEEGFGMVAVEAQSCRIPVIASARGGLPEAVVDGGLLIEDYQNVDAWVEAIGKILGDGGSYGAFADRARRHALNGEFTVANSARRFRDVCLAEVRAPGRWSRGLRAIVGEVSDLPLLRWVIRRAGR